jgi:hypothetical protein
VKGDRRIPVQLIVLDAVGTLLAGIGVAGLITDLSGFLPLMGDPDVVGVIAAAGFALMTFAVLKIARHLRAHRPTQPGPP